MKVELFTLRFAGGKSFYARMDTGTTMAVVDAFEVLPDGDLPVIVGMCSVAIRMRFDPAEAGPKHIRISFVDDEGQPVRPCLESTIEAKTPDPVPIALMLPTVGFPAFGEYSVHLTVDGRLEASTPLYVRQKA